MPLPIPMHDAIIVGAGIGGGALARVLAALGWDVLLIERGAYPRHKVCGEFLSPESQSALRALGLHSPVFALGPRLLNTVEFSTPGRAFSFPLAEPAWGLSRHRLDHTLAESAARAGAQLMTEKTAVAIESLATGFRVRLKTDPSHKDASKAEAALSARVVIGAWGRRPLPGLRPAGARDEDTDGDRGRRPLFVGVKCHIANIAARPAVEMALFQGGYAGLAPIEDGNTNFAALITQTAFKRAGGSAAGLLRKLVDWHPPLARRIHGGEIVDGSALVVGAVDTSRPNRPFSTVPLVGDAATMIPPLCGDGMAMALRSTELCAPLLHRFLKSEIDWRTFRTSYETAWHGEFDGILRTGRVLQRLLLAPLPAAGMLALGTLVPSLARHAFQKTRGHVRPPGAIAEITTTLATSG